MMMHIGVLAVRMVCATSPARASAIIVVYVSHCEKRAPKASSRPDRTVAMVGGRFLVDLERCREQG